MALDGMGRPIVEPRDGSPEWFVRALADAPEQLRVEVEGAEIEVLAWGNGPGPGLMLVHGHGANADWWRPTAPQWVKSAGRVVAFSLSGMGGSDWRPNYVIDQYGTEIAEVARQTGLTGSGRRPMIAGHSFGCLPVLLAAESAGFDRAALIDFYLPAPGRPRAKGRVRQHRRYASFEEAMLRFRLSPPQACPDFIFDFIGHRSLRRTEAAGTEESWMWCSDPAGALPVDHDRFRDLLRHFPLPLTLLRGERSGLVDGHVAAHLREIAPPQTLQIEIPDADHHVLLDRPLSLVSAIRTLLAVGDWTPKGEIADGR
jgi:pimeloyl-ACP methyl ester carboxylesterase